MPSPLPCLAQALRTEEEEDFMTNSMRKALDAVKKEKEEMARQVEYEEDMIVNRLTKARHILDSRKAKEEETGG